MSKRTKLGKCTSGKFKRVNYFHGMLLTEQDFQDEQAYLREKLKLHNRLHGYGVVWGLGLKAKCIEVDTTPKTNKFKIFLEPGFALDCDGNEIIVCYDQLVPLDEKLQALLKACEALPNKLYVAVKYCECHSNPETQYTSTCAEDALHPQFSRMREGFSIQVFTKAEVGEILEGNSSKKKSPDDCCHNHDRQTCPGLRGCCEEENIVFIGCIENFLGKGVVIGDPVNLDYKDEHINRYFQAKRVSPCRSASQCMSDDWEYVKWKTLIKACEKANRIDFSGVVGRTVEEAITYLRSIKLDDNPIIKPIEDYAFKDLLNKVKVTFPCAPENAQIELITDKKQSENGRTNGNGGSNGSGNSNGNQDPPCVLFAFYQQDLR